MSCATANPHQSRAHAAAIELARAISDHLLPRTPAYREIWLDGERIAGGEEEVVEPIYGKTYLPRKFKIVVAVPPSNDVDIFAHDLGYIAILDDAGNVTGWNVTVGGGMGMTHGEPDTYPRTADVMGFCATDDAVKIAEAVVTVQRDWGDRKNRKHARLKYTIEDRGLDAFRAEVERRAGVKLALAKAVHVHVDRRSIRLVAGRRRPRASDAVRAEWSRARHRLVLHSKPPCERLHRCTTGDFRITPNQNLIIANVPTEQQAEIERIAREAGLLAPWSGLRRNSMACVALPTCGLALAESERYLPDLMTALDEKLAAHGLSADDIVIRMTGCPNGCARPYLAEIGLVGKGPGRYNLYLGAAFDGSRLNKLYAEDLDHAGIVAALDPFSPLTQRSGRRASASANSPSAPASSPRPAMAPTSTPIPANTAYRRRPTCWKRTSPLRTKISASAVK